MKKQLFFGPAKHYIDNKEVSHKKNIFGQNRTDWSGKQRMKVKKMKGGDPLTQKYDSKEKEAITKLENEYRHQWQIGDFVIWDNRILMHKANGDYNMNEDRYLFRIMIKN